MTDALKAYLRENNLKLDGWAAMSTRTASSWAATTSRVRTSKSNVEIPPNTETEKP